MFITKKALEEKISRAVCEAKEKEAYERFISERFRDIQSMFDERWHYMDHRISMLESNHMHTADEPVKATR